MDLKTTRRRQRDKIRDNNVTRNVTDNVINNAREEKSREEKSREEKSKTLNTAARQNETIRDTSSEIDLSELVSQIGHLYPKNAHLQPHSPLIHIEEKLILEAVIRDSDKVLTGTKAYAEAVSKWSKKTLNPARPDLSKSRQNETIREEKSQIDLSDLVSQIGHLYPKNSHLTATSPL